MTVGEFLQQHEEILLSAFDATQLIREPILEAEDGTALTPDFILERSDGSHVIGDFALPLLETAKDGKKRRRSSDAAGDLARLTRYGQYFENADNSAFAKTKYGVEVSAPRKLLVTGQETEYAAAADVELVDYETILRLYLAARS
jgi:hypothetical protein